MQIHIVWVMDDSNMETPTATSPREEGFIKGVGLPDYVFIIIYVAEALLILCAIIGMIFLIRRLRAQSHRKKQTPIGERSSPPSGSNDGANRLSAVWNNDLNAQDPNAAQQVRVIINQLAQDDDVAAPNGGVSVENLYAELDSEAVERAYQLRQLQDSGDSHYDSIRGPRHQYESVSLTTFQRRANARTEESRLPNYESLIRRNGDIHLPNGSAHSSTLYTPVGTSPVHMYERQNSSQNLVVVNGQIMLTEPAIDEHNNNSTL